MTTLASAFVEVRPDSTGFGARLKAELGKVKESVDVKANLDSSQFKVAFYGLKRQLSSIAVTKARIDADAASALVTIKGLKLDLKSLTEKVKLGVDDTLAMGKIAEIKAQIASLGTTRGKLDVDSSAAAAKIKILKAELAVLQHTTTEHPIDVRVTGTNFAFRGISGIATAIVGLAPAAVPVLAAVTAGVGVLGSALMSAGAAGGVFGLAVAGDVAQMKVQQQAIKVTTTSLAGLTPHTKEYAAKLKELNAQQKTFNDQFGLAAKGLTDVKAAFSSFLADTRSVTMNVMGHALETVAGILPKLVPLANAAGTAIGGLVHQFRVFSEGAQFQGILDFFQKYGPSAITSFGHILGNLGLGIFQLFKAFAPFQAAFLGGIEAMSKKFLEWATNLHKTDGFKSFMGYVQHVLPDVVMLFSQLSEFVGKFLVALGPLGGVELHIIIELLQGLNSLPSGVLTGIAVGITAIVLGLKAWELGTKAVTIATGIQTGALKAWELATSGALGKTTALGVAARVAAGAAGIGLLIDASKRGGTAVGDLETVVGGAAAGFAIGGPWGAAIGGAIGALKVFTSGSDDAARAQEHLNTLAGQLADTLNAETGALTAASKEKIFQDISTSGLVDAAKKYGVSAKLIIDFSTGVAAAQDKMTKKLAAAIPVEPIKLSAEAYSHLSLVEQSAYDNRRRDFESAQAAFSKFRDSITGERDAVNQSLKDWIAHRKAVGLNIVDAKDYRAALEALPKEARTAIRAEGMDITLRQAQQLFDRYNVLPKEQSTLLKALGFDQAAALVDAAIRKLKDLGNQHPRPRVDIDIGGAYASLSTIRTQLESLHDKTITVNVNTGAIGHLAGGGIFANGVQTMAGGGYGHQAMISKRPVLWAEAGDESYIPHDPAKRTRALGIWAETGRILGVKTLASGAISAADQRAADHALAQAVRALEKQIKHFDVKPGDTASDSRSMVNALAVALRDVVGKDSPLLKHFRALGDHLVDVQKRQDKLGDRYDKAAGQLKATLAAQHQYATSVAAAFTHDAFGGSLADLKLQLKADTNDANTANRALDRARRMGLSGPALRQLAAAGNVALDVQVSHLGRHGIRGLEDMLAARARATSSIGRENAQAIFGDRVDAQTKELHHLGERLRELKHTLEQLEHRVERGARKGVGDREHRASTKRRAT